MSRRDRLVDAVMFCLIGVVTLVLAICLWYLSSLLEADIAVKRATAKALSGLDLRDVETMRVLRGLLGVEEEKKTQ